MADAPVVIRHYGESFSAHAARALLEAHGIPALVIGDDAGGMQPALAYVQGVRLAVRHGDAVRALALLEQVESDDGDLPDDEEDTGDAGPQDKRRDA
jgi:pimeloyl-ACP methyl ester carboxylesterase